MRTKPSVIDPPSSISHQQPSIHNSLPAFLLQCIALALLTTAGVGTAATPREIDAAIQLGAGYLKDHYKGATPRQVTGGPNGTGAAALAGLALLESGTSVDDPAVRAITAGVRDASFTSTQTYHVALCLLYLDRLGDPSDVPIIQMLAVRLLAGQNGNGGWSYDCIEPVSPGEERTLRAALLVTELTAGNRPLPAPGLPGKPILNQGKPGVTGKLHAEVEKYQARLAPVRVRARLDDNSNTQFGLLGTWVARKHGVPVETALDLIERRFLATQTVNGGWPYSGSGQGSPSMTCAGLLGLATALGRREERRMKAEIVRPVPVPKDGPKDPPKPAKSDDPFFNPPPIPKSDDPFFNPIKPARPDPPAKNLAEGKAGHAKPPSDVRDVAIQKGLASLGAVLAGNGPGRGRGKGQQLLGGGGALGDRDLYFLWSVERVGVLYGLDRIGNVDWYDVGAEEIVAAQNLSGSWGRGGRGSEVDTAFALLFLARSNLVRDLTARVQKNASTAELRAGAGPSGDPSPAEAIKPTTPVEPKPALTVIRPSAPAVEDPTILAAELVGATVANWEKALVKTREAKGAVHTQALVLAIHRLEGDRLKAARDALAERLTRMTAETLRTMAKSEDVELRRAAVLAMAMKDDKSHLRDLIAAILDDEEPVVRAARAGLKSLTGQDLGPSPNATGEERKAAAERWRKWVEK